MGLILYKQINILDKNNTNAKVLSCFQHYNF